MTLLRRHIAATAQLNSPVGILSCPTFVTHARARYRNAGRCSTASTKTAALTNRFTSATFESHPLTGWLLDLCSALTVKGNEKRTRPLRVPAKSKDMQIFERAHRSGPRLFSQDSVQASCTAGTKTLNRNSSPLTKQCRPWIRPGRQNNHCKINTRNASHFGDLNECAPARTKAPKRYTEQASAHARYMASDRTLDPHQKDFKCTGRVRSAIVLAISKAAILCGAI